MSVETAAARFGSFTLFAMDVCAEAILRFFDTNLPKSPGLNRTKDLRFRVRGGSRPMIYCARLGVERSIP